MKSKPKKKSSIGLCSTVHRAEVLKKLCARRGPVNLNTLNRICDEYKLFNESSEFTKETLINLVAWLNINKFRQSIHEDDHGVTIKSILWSNSYLQAKRDYITLDQQGNIRKTERVLARNFEHHIMSSDSPLKTVMHIIDSLSSLKLERFRKALQSDGWKLLGRESDCSELLTALSKRYLVDWMISLFPEKSPYELIDYIKHPSLKSYLFTLAVCGRV